MFKKIKLHARNTLLSNYKLLIGPSLLFLVSNFAINIILNYFTSHFLWGSLTGLLRLTVLICFLLLEFVIIPVSLALIFKLIFIINSKETIDIKCAIKKFINFLNVKKIIMINFFPRVFATFFAINNSNISSLNIFKIDGILLIILCVISVFISYKFLLAIIILF